MARRGRPAVAAEVHELRGTWRRDRHASRPTAVPPAPPSVPKAPAHLSKAARGWWLTIATGWALEVHHMRLLTLAAQAWDDAQTARAAVRKEGAVITMPSGAKRPHPAIRREHDARLTFAKLVAQLDLER